MIQMLINENLMGKNPLLKGQVYDLPFKIAKEKIKNKIAVEVK